MTIDFSVKFVNFDKINVELKALPENYKKAVSKSLDQIADILLQEIRKTAPKKTGKYAKSWKKGQKTESKITLETPMGLLYVILEFQGRRPTESSEGKLMVFEADGITIFTRKHKGFKEQPHVRPAIRKVMQKAPSIIFKNLGERVPMFRGSTTN